jgi:multiple sugar transport system substrate-binding protein
MKAWTSLLLIAIVVIVSACGGGAAATPTSAPPTSAAAATATSPSEAATATSGPTATPTEYVPPTTIPGATRVNLWHSMPPATTTYWDQQLMPTFRQNHPECDIVARQLGVEDPAVIRAGLTAGGKDAPDMVWINSAQTGSYVQAGVLADVQGWLDQNPDIKNNIIPSLLDLSSYEGKVWSLPWMTNDTAMWINEDAFNAAGVPIPSQDPTKTWTWAEFADAMQKVTTSDMAGFLVAVGGPVWDTWVYTAWVDAAGGQLLTSSGAPAFQNPPGIAAVKFIKDLVDGGYTTFSELNKGYDAGPWYAGKVAVMANGPWNFPALQTFSDFKFTVVPYPQDKKPSTNLGGDQLFIFNIHQDPAVTNCAFAYAEYMLSDSFQIAFNIQSGNLPVTTSATNSTQYQDHLKQYPFLYGFVNSIPYGVARPELPEYDQVTQIFDQAWDSIMLKSAPITSTLESAANQVSALNP